MQTLTSYCLPSEEQRRQEITYSRTRQNNLPEVLSRHTGPNIELQGHIHNTMMNLATRNNLLKKLANSKWRNKVQPEQPHWLYATQSQSMQHQYGQGLHMHIC